jgi:hypothetical protein
MTLHTSLRIAPLALAGIVAANASAAFLYTPGDGYLDISFQNLTWLGDQFSIALGPDDTHDWTGTLTAVEAIGVTGSGPLVNRFTVYALATVPGMSTYPPLSGGVIQLGGLVAGSNPGQFTGYDLGADFKHAWSVGGAPPTIDELVIVPATVVDGLSLLFGNGVAGTPSGGPEGTFSGTIRLHGVTYLPTPAATALLAIAGLCGACGRRRR